MRVGSRQVYKFARVTVSFQMAFKSNKEMEKISTAFYNKREFVRTQQKKWKEMDCIRNKCQQKKRVASLGI